MSKPDSKEIKKRVKRFAPHLRNLALEMRSWVRDRYPASNELIYDKYNTLAFGWSITDKLTHTFCTMAIYTEYLHFGFYWGNEVHDPEKKLLGKGKQYRYIVVRSIQDFPMVYMENLVSDSYINAQSRITPGLKYPKGASLVKSEVSRSGNGMKKQGPLE